MDQSEALLALQAKNAAEAQLARACNCPLWRHAVFGVMMGALIASGAFDTPIRTAILVVILACIPLIIRSDRKRMGMFINGYRRGKTRVVVAAILAVELSMYMMGAYYGMMLQKPLVPLLLGAAGVPIGIGGSLLWQRVFVRELTA